MSMPPAGPRDDPPLSSSIQRLIAEACERFRAEWRGRTPPRIGEFLEGLKPDEREHVLRALETLDASLRKECDEPRPDRDRPDADRAGSELAETVFTSSSRPASSAQEHDHEDEGLARTNGAPRESDAPAPEPVPEMKVGPPSSGSSGSTPALLPERLGRYRVIRALGEGSFGHVYLAVDDELGRQVAVKVPNDRVLRSPRRVATIIEEARHAAGLRHPAIVAVHDFGHGSDGVPFVVLDYVEGTTLADYLRDDRPVARELAEILARVADALHYAHKAGLVHRDLKPSNIMIDRQGQPMVGDFGLAIAEDDQLGRMGEIAGTPPYMAPEQVRGETHRLDGRTDVWALGVILYEGMTGRLPFRARGRAEFFDEILHRDPRPPRQIDDSLPRELERICLKCLSRRMNDRYQTAGDLAEDLRSWMTAAALGSTLTATPEPGSARGPGACAPVGQTTGSGLGTDATRPAIIPKGLRPFDRGDADFFLDLLPGPRGRDGLPDSIRFWKARIESRDRERAFAVGLLYGPSGCGKSSLVRAGLLERVDPSVVRIYLEAVPGETESILREMLRRRFPQLPAGADLAALLAQVRGGGVLPAGEKLIIVLDQFEQWLHAHPAESDCELVRGLRQCDGERVQALLLVRDDFWMAITQFFRALEVRLAEGRNSAAVELFDAKHARRVLRVFGCAYGRIADGEGGDAPELTQFLDRAVAELSGPDGRVIPVRLCLLAEMLRRRPWVPATLRDLGGFEGIGATFLEETFGPSAPPTHRLHAAAAQAVLKALLPEPGSDLKGKLRTVQGLREASGYADRPADFDALLAILDTELRLVTPADPEQAAEPGAHGADPRALASYQLTHDYLVPSLRSWLTRRQRETRRGRAELRLASMAALWRDRPEPRYLPSLSEWLGILGNTRARDRDESERTMMRAAARRHLTRLGAGLAVASAVGVAVWWIERERQAASLLGQAQRASYANLGPLIPDLDSRIGVLRGRLERALADRQATDRERQIAGVLLYRDHPTPERALYLRDRMRRADVDELAVLRDALAAHPADAGIAGIRAVVVDDSAAPAVRLRMACAMARLDPAQAGLAADAPAIAEAMLQEDPRSLSRWVELLGVAAPSLVSSLGRICRDPGRESTTRASAAEALGEVLGDLDDAADLARCVVDSLPDASRILRRKLERLGPRSPALVYLRGVLEEAAPGGADEPTKDQLARRQAGAAVALAALGEPGALWPRLRHRDDPRLRSILIQRLAGAGLPPDLLVDRLAHPASDPIERQALLMACAETDRARIPATVQASVVQTAARLHDSDPHPAVHSAAGLLLARWGAGHLARKSGPPALAAPAPDGLRWDRGPEGHTFAILPAPLVFRMGSPEGERGRDVTRDREKLHHRRIDRSIAVATREVSLRQLRAFDREHVQDPRHGDELDCPANKVSWYVATQYCNWLSKQAGLDPSEWCYPERFGKDVLTPDNPLERHGYRLPTEAEWEYLCRALTVTSRPYGESEELLPKYAWTSLNSEDYVKPVGSLLPNEFGLFDVLGNVWEWCHDGQVMGTRKSLPDYPDGTPEHPAPDRPTGQLPVDDTVWRTVRGGAFDYSPMHARAASRYSISVNLKDPYLGFRVVRTLPPRGD